MTAFAGYLLLFLGLSVFFLFIHLVIGKMIRPSKPDADKLTIYECGEPTVGSAWIQFDLRYYVVALLFVIFDVEVVFFFPWALVFGKANQLAMTGTEISARNEVARTLLLPNQLPNDSQVTATGGALVDPRTASNLAWIAFYDILVFFGVLMLGFAYLWKRGDLDWVRSTLAEQRAPPVSGGEGKLAGVQ
jgi:NADH-quinone oxidoreductase subunit A